MAELSLLNLKRRAAKLGLAFRRSNWRRDSIDNLGGYMVVETATNTVVDGARYDLELTAVRDVIEHWEEDDESEPQKASGPAEVAPSPSHGPNNPCEENAVNEQHRIIAPTATPSAIPATAPANARPDLFSIDVNAAALALAASRGSRRRVARA